MPLTDTHIRSLKPDVKPRKYFDGGGLFLFVPANGNKLWRMAYRFDGKSKLLSFGEYPPYRSRTPENAAKRRSVCCPGESTPQTINGRYDRPEPRRNATASRMSPENGMKPAWRSFPKSIREPSCTGWGPTFSGHQQNARRQTGDTGRYGGRQASGTEGKLRNFPESVVNSVMRS